MYQVFPIPLLFLVVSRAYLMIHAIHRIVAAQTSELALSDSDVLASRLAVNFYLTDRVEPEVIIKFV